MWSQTLDIQRDNGVTICTDGTVAHDLQQPAQKSNTSPAAARLDAGLPSVSHTCGKPGRYLWPQSRNQATRNSQSQMPKTWLITHSCPDSCPDVPLRTNRERQTSSP